MVEACAGMGTATYIMQLGPVGLENTALTEA